MDDEGAQLIKELVLALRAWDDGHPCCGGQFDDLDSRAAAYINFKLGDLDFKTFEERVTGRYHKPVPAHYQYDALAEKRRGR